MASVYVTNSNPNISKPADACSRALLQKFTRISIVVLIWLKSEHGISWTQEKLISSVGYGRRRLVQSGSITNSRVSDWWALAHLRPDTPNAALSLEPS